MTTGQTVTADRVESIANEVHLHKFGGSSLADAFCYRRVARIVTEHAGSSDLVIVSAAGDTTNRILAIWEAREKQPEYAATLLDSLQRYQQGLIDELLSGRQQQDTRASSEHDFVRWRKWLIGEEKIEKAELCAYGELWSARLLAALLQKQGTRADYIDARTFLSADDAAEPVIHTESSRQALIERIAPYPGTRFIVTGFICQEAGTGRTLLLGRNGSDYSATLIGSLINSRQTTIWKDVAGVYSADPRKVERVVSLPTLDWQEAEELARLGSPVLHPRTFQPVDRERMVISVRSSLKVENQQTRIGQYELAEAQGKVLTSLQDVTLFSIPLKQKSLLQAFEENQLEPLISWTDNDAKHFAFHQNLLDYVRDFLAKLDDNHHAQEVSGYSMVALVGARIKETRQFAVLKRQVDEQQLRQFAVADNGHSAIAILGQKLDNRLLNRLHSLLFNFRKSIGILVLGRGNIGSEWLQLFRQQRDNLNESADVKIMGVANSKRLWLDYNGVDLQDWQESFDRLARPYVLTELLRELANAPCDEMIVMDLTDASAVAQQYPSLFANGMHVISANKRAGSSPDALYREIRTIQQEYKREWLYNTTVGAGLPLNYAINDLMRSGDKIHGISGIFSGTMSWLFEHYDHGKQSFSELIRKAKAEGFTEPDPREDLSCHDIVRKLLIVARDIGAQLDWSDVEIEGLVPEHLKDLPLEEFMERLSELDEPMEQLWNSARKDNKLPRLMASFEVRDGRSHAKVGIELIDNTDMLTNLIPGENIFVISSDWYNEMPLVISGPGAGRKVTAGGVQSDLHQLLGKLIQQQLVI
ncbi:MULTISPECIES: bifunctional aspartate kinase/homoserine dehydrogenase II [Gammaproteobacteria]|uniref:bifunctional aspartate kinase/homoserine dehydrogenase II n=1 Tax=Gammaproteobacteria TaxID=1236 RepID=UPI000DD086C5|nr:MULTISPECIES: bifunctional aspartate kinase/homoserine dehydrogenase II [Gammaproteobacteria]RTE85915.1 bifunctional aspartate kinase/homoserine dehydrogenase II [Aliidiomarina sp. B3213]TCZ90086.1 bifunctional aspartate kinase/homoserine dehydrogenase II [Lysobacter sp. N42]